MDKLVVRGTEINVQWDLKRDDFLSLTDIAKIKDSDKSTVHHSKLASQQKHHRVPRRVGNTLQSEF